MIRAWRGAEIAERIATAAREAIDETTAAAAKDAQGAHWWKTRRAKGLQAEIVSEPAEENARGVVTGRFGTTERRGFYGLFHERRTPFLRPAADREFPKLAERIKGKL